MYEKCVTFEKEKKGHTRKPRTLSYFSLLNLNKHIRKMVMEASMIV